MEFTELGKTARLNRRAREKGLPATWTKGEREYALEYFGGCALTGELEHLTFDHVIPLATGYGGSTIANLVPMRGDLNICKGDQNVFEWFEANHERLGLDPERFETMVNYLAIQNDMSPEYYRAHTVYCHSESDTLGSYDTAPTPKLRKWKRVLSNMWTVSRRKLEGRG